MRTEIRDAVTEALAAHQYRIFPGQCSCQEPGEFMTTSAHVDHVAEIMLESVAFSHTTIDGQRLTWKQLYEREQTKRLELEDYQIMLSDLSRNEHGRHKGDSDAYDPTGTSQGNPHLETGSILGYSLGGSYRYVVPRHEHRGDINAWRVRNR